MNNRTGSIESTRVLNLKDYIRLFNEISQQAAMATLKSSDGCSAISASIILTEYVFFIIYPWFEKPLTLTVQESTLVVDPHTVRITIFVMAVDL